MPARRAAVVAPSPSIGLTARPSLDRRRLRTEGFRPQAALTGASPGGSLSSAGSVTFCWMNTVAPPQLIWWSSLSRTSKWSLGSFFVKVMKKAPRLSRAARRATAASMPSSKHVELAKTTSPPDQSWAPRSVTSAS